MFCGHLQSIESIRSPLDENETNDGETKARCSFFQKLRSHRNGKYS